MRLLLDTHAFLWWATGSERLTQQARGIIDDDANIVFVSAASAWEITTKHRRGRLDEAADIAPNIESVINAQGFEGLPITVADAARAGALPGLHNDPFDRMLIAQALSHDLTIVSNESLFDGYGVHRIW